MAGNADSAKEILQACVRLDIYLSHAPIRYGATKGKIERVFRGFRDRFLRIGMAPIERVNLDRDKIKFRPQPSLRQQ